MINVTWKMRVVSIAAVCFVGAVVCSAVASVSRENLAPNVGGACYSTQLHVEWARKSKLPFRDLVRKDLIGLVAKKADGREGKAWRTKHGGYDFLVVGHSYKDYVIRAVSHSGGRNYVYDPRVRIVRLEFRSDEERRKMGQQLKRLYKGDLLLAERNELFLTIPHRQGLDKKEFDSVLANYLGDLLAVKELQDFVLSVAFEDKMFDVRYRCLRSIRSVFGSLPKELRDKISKKATLRLQAIQAGKVKGHVPEHERDALKQICTDLPATATENRSEKLPAESTPIGH